MHHFITCCIYRVMQILFVVIVHINVQIVHIIVQIVHVIVQIVHVNIQILHVNIQIVHIMYNCTCYCTTCKHTVMQKVCKVITMLCSDKWRYTISHNYY
jgi:hypothetical protein